MEHEAMVEEKVRKEQTKQAEMLGNAKADMDGVFAKRQETKTKRHATNRHAHTPAQCISPLRAGLRPTIPPAPRRAPGKQRPPSPKRPRAHQPCARPPPASSREEQTQAQLQRSASTAEDGPAVWAAVGNICDFKEKAGSAQDTTRMRGLLVQLKHN
jgi:hypothetical protein